MDLKLQNAYVEVLLNNFMEVVKQNILFQAQIEVLSKDAKEFLDNQKKLKDVSESNIQLQQQINSLVSEKNSSKFSGVNIESVLNEKNRLQSAVNDYMRKLNESKTELLTVKSEFQDVLLQNNNRIEELNKYISRLENVVPANKFKKLKTTDTNQEETIESPKLNENITDNDSVKNGGTF